MKLSNNTLTLLKNYSTINGNLVVKEGNKILTISDKKNIMSSAEVEESFSQPFGIYDLNEFLGAYSLIQDPNLEFSQDSVTMSSGDSSIIYRFSDPNILTSPDREVGLPSEEINVTLTYEVISNIRKASAVLNAPVLSIISSDDSDEIECKVFDPSNPTANIYKVTLTGLQSQDTFDFQFLIENLKMLADDYRLTISSKLISQWEGINNKVKYWIALERNSTYVT
jgi:hypothetical protein